jgi:cytochrome c-type biogenesis protein CcmF
MVVHIGVILVAVGLAASQSYARTSDVSLKPGESIVFGGHTIVYVGKDVVETKQSRAERARVTIDGAEYAPAQVLFNSNGQIVPRPSVRTRPWGDVYLSLAKPVAADGTANLQIVLNPLIMWLWIGGLVMGFGTVLAMFPGRKRRLATDAASAPIPEPHAEPDPVLA